MDFFQNAIVIRGIKCENILTIIFLSFPTKHLGNKLSQYLK